MERHLQKGYCLNLWPLMGRWMSIVTLANLCSCLSIWKSLSSNKSLAVFIGWDNNRLFFRCWILLWNERNHIVKLTKYLCISQMLNLSMVLLSSTSLVYYIVWLAARHSSSVAWRIDKVTLHWAYRVAQNKIPHQTICIVSTTSGLTKNSLSCLILSLSHKIEVFRQNSV